MQYKENKMPNVENFLKSYFTQNNIADVLTKMSKPNTPIKDLLFPENTRKQKASAYLALSEVKDTIKAIPIVKRGAQSYPLSSEGKSSTLIEVEGFRASEILHAKELNDVGLTGDNINSLLSERVEKVRDRISISTEILCAQSLSGKISYPVVTAGGLNDTYEVEIGKPVNMTATNIKGKTLDEVFIALEAQFTEQIKTGESTDVRFLCGIDAYSEIISIATNAKTALQWTDYGCVLFGKYKLQPMSGTYVLPGKTDVTNIVDTKSIQTINIANTGKLFYTALDDVDARLAPLPFFAKQVKIDDPSGYKIIGMSKPFPALAVSKTTLRKYLA